MPACTHEPIIAATRRWLERAVIGLNLCPFAKSVYAGGRLRLRVSDADSPAALQVDLRDELSHLDSAPVSDCETTLLIHPWVLADFLDYNDFLDLADAEVAAAGLRGVVQIASFHPEYRFADAAPDDIANFTNRSPHPMLHLLRESSVERAVAAFPDAAGIFGRNIETMQRLGQEGWRRLLDTDA